MEFVFAFSRPVMLYLYYKRKELWHNIEIEPMLKLKLMKIFGKLNYLNSKLKISSVYFDIDEYT